MSRIDGSVTSDWTEVLVVVAGLGPSLRPALPPAPGWGPRRLERAGPRAGNLKITTQA